jgi:hypothetical protein
MARYTKFTFPISSYQPQALQEGFSEKELRREYSRLRSVARKRLERFAGTEWEDTNVYRYNKGRYKPVAQVTSKTELARLLSDVARFLTAEGGSVSGQKSIRDKAIATWKAKGYDWINTKNYASFARFLEFSREFVGQPYMEKAAELFRRADEQGVDPEQIKANYDWYWKHFDEESMVLPSMPNTRPAPDGRFKKVVYKGGRKRNR